VLFLDELPEFRQATLDALRQPLEDGSILLTRAQRTVRFPTRFMLVAAANPCPCGNRGDPKSSCDCPNGTVARYLARLNGPLVDRIDIVQRVGVPPREELMSERSKQTSAEIRTRVVEARTVQTRRLAGTAARCNAELRGGHLQRICALKPEAQTTLHNAHQRVKLTGRGHFGVLRVARTIADLAGRDAIDHMDIAEAVALRL
jgi:magnesium chelatase family protein